MADQISGPLQVAHVLIQLQRLFSHEDSLHPRDDTVLRSDGPNHLVPARTLPLSLRARSKKLKPSIPLG